MVNILLRTLTALSLLVISLLLANDVWCFFNARETLHWFDYLWAPAALVLIAQSLHYVRTGTWE